MKVGPYEVLGELGRGGMGAVYRVRTPDGSDAALKLIAKTDAATFARFERERRLLASLGEKEGFVGLLDAGTSPGGAWLVMPLVPGGTLRKRLEAGPLPVEETVKLGLALARALGAAHERGIVHRDVKPENVLFTGGPGAETPNERWPGRPLIADLGLAKHFDRSAPGGSQSLSQTAHGTLKGTAGYMAPEQLEDPGSVGPPCDVFALGAVLYECLAGHPPFAGGSVLEVLARAASGSVAPIDRPGVPEWLGEIVLRALSRDPLERYASGTALAHALAGKTPARSRRALAPLLAGTGTGAVLVLALLLVLRAPRPAAPPSAPPPAPPRTELAPGTAPTGPTPKEIFVVALGELDRGDLDEAIRDASKVIELDAAFAEAWAIRGRATSRKGDHEKALADSTRAVELGPDFSSVWANRGIVYQEKGDLDRAIADFSKSLELDPSFAEVWCDRGIAFNVKGDFEAAIPDLVRATEIDPALARAWANLGGPLAETGNVDRGIDALSRAIELAPGKAVFWQNRGLVLLRKPDLDRAIADFSKAIELAPAGVTAWVGRGKARGLKREFDGAIADLTRAVELDPRDPRGWVERGTARARKGDLDAAIDDFAKAIELDPASADYRLYRAAAQLDKGDLDAAIAGCSKALELDPRHMNALLKRASARGGKGDLEGALADYERAIELDTSGRETPRIRGFIEETKKRAR